MSCHNSYCCKIIQNGDKVAYNTDPSGKPLLNPTSMGFANGSSYPDTMGSLSKPNNNNGDDASAGQTPAANVKKGTVIRLLTDGVVGGTATNTMLWSAESPRYVVDADDGNGRAIVPASAIVATAAPDLPDHLDA